MAEYEYMVLPVGGLATAGANVAGQLNRLGDEGWRVAATLESSGATREIVLMRERPGADPPAGHAPAAPAVEANGAAGTNGAPAWMNGALPAA